MHSQYGMITSNHYKIMLIYAMSGVCKNMHLSSYYVTILQPQIHHSSNKHKDNTYYDFLKYVTQMFTIMPRESTVLVCHTVKMEGGVTFGKIWTTNMITFVFIAHTSITDLVLQYLE